MHPLFAVIGKVDKKRSKRREKRSCIYKKTMHMRTDCWKKGGNQIIIGLSCKDGNRRIGNGFWQYDEADGGMECFP